MLPKRDWVEMTWEDFRDADAALIREAATKVGAFALGPESRDAAIVVYLEPGAYTVEVGSSVTEGDVWPTGIALVEVYEDARE